MLSGQILYAIGFRGTGGAGRTASIRDVAEESLMLTGDQNIIDIDFVVQWRIKNAKDYLFNIRDPQATAKLAAESAIREVAGQNTLEDVLAKATSGRRSKNEGLCSRKFWIPTRPGSFVAEVKMQKVDPPQPVIDAFNDVQRAKQDKERAAERS